MAIKAHLDQRQAGDSQRTTPRRALRLETSGFVAGTAGTEDEANVIVHNISAAGLLLETELALDEGEQFALDLPEVGLVTVMVVWRSEHLFGCAFERAISAAALAASQLQGFAPRADPHADPAAQAVGAGDSLGPRLNRLRREAGLTLADVAATLGVSKPTVWAWEKGKARPLPERIAAIAAALGVAPDALAPAPPAPGGFGRDTNAVIAACRQRIADACGTAPEAVRIMIEV